MNLVLLDRIATWLEAGGNDGKRRFHLGIAHWSDTPACQTICCIAGAACDFADKVPKKFLMATARDLRTGFEVSVEDPDFIFAVGGFDAHWGDIAKEARKLLDLDRETASLLFEPDSYEQGAEYTPAWAARCIRKLMATGVVDWMGTRPNEPTPQPRVVTEAVTAIQEEPNEHAIA